MLPSLMSLCVVQDFDWDVHGVIRWGRHGCGRKYSYSGNLAACQVPKCFWLTPIHSHEREQATTTNSNVFEKISISWMISTKQQVDVKSFYALLKKKVWAQFDLVRFPNLTKFDPPSPLSLSFLHLIKNKILLQQKKLFTCFVCKACQLNLLSEYSSEYIPSACGRNS